MKETLEKLNSRLSVVSKEVTASTNDDAVLLAKNGALDGTVIIAERQTKGRGRMGRQFVSDFGGAYFSVITRPDLKAVDITLLTPAAAVAVVRVLERHSGKKCEIKWVNDILINSKKVCGILTEGGFSGDRLDFAVVGIGINLVGTREDLPDEIRDIADFVFTTLSIREKALIISEIISEFYEILKSIKDRRFMAEYTSRSVLMGKKITYIKKGQSFEGTVCGIDKNASLEVLQNGERIKIFAGEVSVKYEN